MTMWALRHPAIIGAVPLRHGWAKVGNIGALCAGALLVAALGVLPPPLGAAVGVAALHGGLIAAALVWGGVGRGAATVAIGLLFVARAAAGIHPAGVLAYVLVPLWLATLAWRGRLSRLALSAPWPWAAVVTGALAGTALGLHLMTCASRTLGYAIRVDAATMIPALAYDVGANVLSAELFFRGALLQSLWRRWPFAGALSVAALAAALRYTLDPFVAATELRVGAAVYMTLLAVLNGALYRWSTNLLPGLAAATMFFACYRLLAKS
jgi:hypothetical protein